MIATVSGVVRQISINSAVIEVAGIGLLIHITPRTAASLSTGTSTTLHTSLIVREDALTLYGFLDSSSKEFFELLQTVTGIGPKVAQSALSIYEPAEIASAIRNENSALIERIPGLGKKGAARVVLELKDKVETISTSDSPAETNRSPWQIQVSGALENLGIAPREIEQILNQLRTEVINKAIAEDLPGLLRRALQLRGSQL